MNGCCGDLGDLSDAAGDEDVDRGLHGAGSGKDHGRRGEGGCATDRGIDASRLTDDLILKSFFKNTWQRISRGCELFKAKSRSLECIQD